MCKENMICLFWGKLCNQIMRLYCPRRWCIGVSHFLTHTHTHLNRTVFCFSLLPLKHLLLWRQGLLQKLHVKLILLLHLLLLPKAHLIAHVAFEAEAQRDHRVADAAETQEHHSWVCCRVTDPKSTDYINAAAKIHLCYQSLEILLWPATKALQVLFSPWESVCAMCGPWDTDWSRSDPRSTFEYLARCLYFCLGTHFVRDRCSKGDGRRRARTWRPESAAVMPSLDGLYLLGR